MSILSWLGEILWNCIHLLWSILWFLIGGWFSSLAQIFVLFCFVLIYKYGWQRAPTEILSRLSGVLRYLWVWVRQREAPSFSDNRDTVRVVRIKEFGDINISTMLNVIIFLSFVIYSFSFILPLSS